MTVDTRAPRINIKVYKFICTQLAFSEKIIDTWINKKPEVNIFINIQMIATMRKHFTVFYPVDLQTRKVLSRVHNVKALLYYEFLVLANTWQLVNIMDSK